MDLKSKYYVTKKSGGFSPCILGNNSRGQRYAAGSVLPNCVGFVWGWWHEVAGLKAFNFWGKGDARNLYDVLHSQGCQTGMDPAPGAMMIWDSENCGHAAICTEVLPDGSIKTLESGWEFSGDPVQQYIRSGEHWRKGCRWMSKNYTFKGFVYHPCLPRIQQKEYIIMGDGSTVFLPTIFCDGRNYPQLSALSDVGMIKAGYNVIRRLPEIGKAP